MIDAVRAAELSPAEINPAGIVPAGEGCPPPLAWQEVLATFRTQSTGWELPRGRYCLRGRTWGTGAPLYFLNGLGGTHELFALTAYLMRDQFCCVFHDYPDASAGRVTLDELAANLIAIADLHGHRQFAVLATSFGGLASLQALLQYPERVERAVLQGAFAHRQLSWAERMLIPLGRMLPFTLNQLPGRRMVHTNNHRPWFPPLDETRWQFFLDNTAPLPLADLACRGAVIRDSDLRQSLPQIRQPVLLVRGEGDGLVTESCQSVLRTGLPHARDEWLHSSGHLPYLTHPHRLVKLIKPFLSEAVPAATPEVNDGSVDNGDGFP